MCLCGEFLRPFAVVGEVGSAGEDDLIVVITPEDLCDAAGRVDVNFAGSFEHESTQDGSPARAGAGGRGFAGTTFPDAKLDIVAVCDLYKDDIRTLRKFLMRFHRAANGAPVEIEILNKDARHRIAYIYGRE